MNDAETIATQAAELEKLRETVATVTRERDECAKANDVLEEKLRMANSREYHSKQTLSTLTQERDDARSIVRTLDDEHKEWVEQVEAEQVKLQSQRDAAIAERDEARAAVQPCEAQERGSREHCNCIVCTGFKELRAERDSIASQLDAANARITELVASWNQEHDEHVKANVRVRELEEKLNEADNCIREFAKSSL